MPARTIDFGPSRGLKIGFGLIFGALVFCGFLWLEKPPAPAPQEKASFDGVAEARIDHVYAVEHPWYAAAGDPFRNEKEIPWRVVLDPGERVRVIEVRRQVRVPGVSRPTNYSLVQSISHPSKAPEWVPEFNLDEAK